LRRFGKTASIAADETSHGRLSTGGGNARSPTVESRVRRIAIAARMTTTGNSDDWNRLESATR